MDTKMKILPILSCHACNTIYPNPNAYSDLRNKTFTCMHWEIYKKYRNEGADRIVTKYVIEGGFPKWCPLEDYKQ